MDLKEALSQARGVASVRRVDGKPYQRDGVVVIPAARIRGAGGGGGGEGGQPERDTGSGSGLGLAFSARPVGAYVIRDGKVRWKPAIDVTSVVLRLQAALILILLALLRRRR